MFLKTVTKSHSCFLFLTTPSWIHQQVLSDTKKYIKSTAFLISLLLLLPGYHHPSLPAISSYLLSLFLLLNSSVYCLHSWPNLLRTKMFLPLICLKPCNDFPLHAELSSNSLQLSTRLWDDPCLPLLNFTSHISSPYSYASATLPYSLLLEHTRTVPASWFWHLIFSLPGILFMW